MTKAGFGRLRSRFGLRTALAVTSMLGSGLAAPALAQSSLPTVRATLDENGVDLATGTYNLSAATISIGGPNGLAWVQGRQDILVASIHSAVNPGTGQTELEVVIGALRNVFVQSGSTFTSKESDGSTLTLSGTTYTYTAASGDVGVFQKVNTSTTVPIGVGNEGYITSLRLRSGKTLTYYYSTVNLVVGQSPGGLIYRSFMRLQTVSSGNYQLHATYSLATATTTAQVAAWQTRTRLMALNTTVDACSVAVNSCTTTVSWPLVDFDSSGHITDALGRVTTVTGGATTTAIRFPGSGSDDITIAYSSAKVSSVTNNGVATTYGYADVGTTRTTTVTRGSLPARTLTFNITTLRILSDTRKADPSGPDLVTSYTYDTSARPKKIIAPEGNYTELSYDARGNVTEVRQVSKTPGTPADIVTSATYDATCTNPVTCNSPNTTTDARGGVTNYTYDSTHGGVLTVTAPAPTVGAVRPQTRYSYTQLADDGTPSSSGTWMQTGTSACVSTASCAGTSDEVKTTITYGAGLNVSSVTRAAGNGTPSATTSYGYDIYGNQVSVDGPLSGTADTTYTRFDLLGRQLGQAGPDPDGGGSLKARATRTTYNTDGTVASVEMGTDTTPSSSGFGGFTAAQQVSSTYDANHRRATDTLVSGSTAYQLTQYSYDALGRLECSAQRMNSAIWTSLPTSACTVGTAGTYGADRIVKTTYDALDRATKVQTGYGVSGVQADEVITTYTANGKVATAIDAENNKTSFEYDGFDRSLKAFLPVATKGSGSSSTTDYQQLTYDAANNVTARRLRDGTTISYTFDSLNRLTAKDLPGSEPDVSYTYDLLGRVTGASQTGNALTFTYDALGRNTSQGGPQGTVSYQYDAASRRTRMDWPDPSPNTFYVTYDHLVTGEVTAIRENGAASGVGVLATYAYDDLGHRTSVTYGNGTVTSYAFDNISRLSSLGINLDGSTTTNDVTTSLAYSPASQISSQTRTNDLYAWDGHTNVARGYTSNGLNQYTAVGATSPTYDSRGNLTASGGNSYGYSSENLLTSATVSGNSLTFGYDPMLRLYQEAGSTTARFLYDGTDMIGEANSSNVLQKRYVFGPGADEPLVEYAGSGTGSGVRTFLHADERGSIVARSNESGAKTGILSYDEYGIPYGSNTGRFQYTGQAWLAQLGMDYYKARIYSPSLGRFMQTDPVGYDDGMNWYNYAKSDPVNASDPSGLATIYIPGVSCGEIYIPYSGGQQAGSDEIVVNGGNFAIQCGPTYISVNVPDLNYTPQPGGGGGRTPVGNGGQAQYSMAAPGPKRDRTCVAVVDTLAAIFLIGTGVKEGLHSLEYLNKYRNIIRIFTTIKTAALASGISLIAIGGLSLLYYYERDEILDQVCGK